MTWWQTEGKPPGFLPPPWMVQSGNWCGSRRRQLRAPLPRQRRQAPRQPTTCCRLARRYWRRATSRCGRERIAAVSVWRAARLRGPFTVASLFATLAKKLFRFPRKKNELERGGAEGATIYSFTGSLLHCHHMLYSEEPELQGAMPKQPLILHVVWSMQSKVMVPRTPVCSWGTTNLFFCQSVCLFVFCRHESGKAAIGVRVDRQRQLMHVLRFDIDGCWPIFLSLVKPLIYLRLKTTYPRRHRPIR
jgi:hypothetical protein